MWWQGVVSVGIGDVGIRGALAVALAGTGVVKAVGTAAAWRKVERLPAGVVDDALVAVVVPARDEEANLDRCLRSLRAQAHERLRITVVDDGSTDATAAIARRHAEADPRVRVITAAEPPPGWAGKAHALHVGARAADAEFLLFLDADTEAAPELVGRLVAAARRWRVDLVSVAGHPPARGHSWWSLFAPMTESLLTVASPDGSRGRALAVGHCVLVRRVAHERSGGWEAIRGARVDDLGYAALVRDTGGRTRFADASGALLVHGVDGVGAAWRSVTRSSVALVAETGGGAALFGAAALAQLGYGALHVLMAVRGRGVVRWAGLLAWAAQAATSALYLRRVGQPVARAALAPVGATAFGALLARATWLAGRGGADWKGRDVRG